MVKYTYISKSTLGLTSKERLIAFIYINKTDYLLYITIVIHISISTYVSIVSVLLYTRIVDTGYIGRRGYVKVGSKYFFVTPEFIRFIVALETLYWADISLMLF